MALPNSQINIKAPQETKLLDYARKAHDLLNNQFSLRDQLMQIDREYMRESDYTESELRAKIANRTGDKKKFQNVTVPIVMPQVRAALAYMANVFLTGYPIFGISSDPQNEDAALQMETLVAENAITAGWARQLMMFFNDGLKYNLHAVECTWDQKTTASIENDPNSPNGAKVNTTLWQGNCLKRMDLYNTFFDPRVHPAEIHSEGEYAGYIEMYSRVRMKKFINDLFGKVPTTTAIRAFESAPSNTSAGSSMGIPYSYYAPIINPFPIMNRQNTQTFDWLQWANAEGSGAKGIKYTNVYEIMRLYARIIPSDFDFDVPAKNTPQVFKLTIVNNAVVLMVERQTDAHNFIPIFFGQPLEDGLDYQTKSFASNVIDMQDVASAMWNGYIASKRRLVGDRVLYDPLRVRQKDINSTDPAAKIPVRPSAYGKPVAEAVFQFPFRDEQTSTLIQGADLVSKFADKINNQNPAQQGQFVKGNKTQHEYDDVMGHGNSGNQTMAIMTEGQVLTPLKQVILLNYLLYQQDATIYNRDKKQQVAVNPVDLRKAAVHFKVSDGLVPKDQEMSTDEFQTVIQTSLQAPALTQDINLGDMFAYLLKMRGADISPFMKSPAQQQYEQQLSAWQQTAAQLMKANPQMKPEDLAKALGPMPQPSQQLQQEQQQKQQQGGVPASKTSTALESTQQGQGDNAPAQPQPAPRNAASA